MTPVARRLHDLLRSAEFARAYSLAVLSAVFAGFAIERMTSAVTYTTIILLFVVIGAAVLVVRRAELSLLRFAPSSLLAFVALAGLSVMWTTVRGDTLLGWLSQLAIAALAIVVGHIRDTLQTVRALGDTLRALLVVSLGVEILSGVLLDIPITFLDVEGRLALGGPIQGIFGTRNMLGFVAVIALVTFVVEWRSRSITSAVAVPSVALAGFLALLSASPTVLVLAAAVGVVTAALSLVRRMPASYRPVAHVGLAGLVAVSLAIAFALRHRIIAWLGAGSDFDVRATLWNTILDFVAFRPLNGWGWFGPWQIDEYPFRSLNHLVNDHHLTALNAYFDTLLQLGWIGLILFVLLGGVALVRSWLVASTRRSNVYAWTPLVLVTLAVLSMFESFTLFGTGWFLLVLCALRAGQSRSWREDIDAAHTGVIPTLPPLR